MKNGVAGVSIRNGFSQAVTAVEIAVVLAVLVVVALVGLVFLRGFVVRQKIRQTNRDLQRLAIAIESYCVDWSSYPFPIEYLLTDEFLDGPWGPKPRPDRDQWVKRLQLGPVDEYGHYATAAPGFWPCALTTPVAFLDRIPNDPFRRGGDRSYGYMFHVRKHGQYPYILVGCGPDGDRDLPVYHFGRDTGRKERLPYDLRGYYGFAKLLICYKYDPTNGLRSDGDVFFFSAVDNLYKPPWNDIRAK